MTKFWEETGTALSKRLFASGGAGLVFWTWAVAMWAIHQGGWRYVQDTVRALTSDTGLATLLANAEHGGDSRRDEPRIGQRRQLHEPRSMRVPLP